LGGGLTFRSYGNPSKYIWAQWDEHLGSIHLIEKNFEGISSFLTTLWQTRSGTQTPQVDAEFLGKKDCSLFVLNPLAPVEEVEEIRVQLDLSAAVSSRHQRTEYDYRSQPVFSRYLTLVKLPGELCLCQQHPIQVEELEIRVNILWIQPDEEMRFSFQKMSAAEPKFSLGVSTACLWFSSRGYSSG
jgi:hypothetical protein